MKRVSFKVAKAIDEAGYPQCSTDYVYVVKEAPIHKYGSPLQEGSLVSYEVRNYATCVDAPFAMEVWLWLWRNKDLYVNYNPQNGKVCIIGNNIELSCVPDPEEAIITAIEHLCDNDLIK